MSKTESGHTIIETLVAFSLFAVIAAGAAPAMIMNMKYNTQMQIKTEATGAAQQFLDGLRVYDPSTLPTSGSDPAVVVSINNHAYSVIAEYCSIPSYCTSSARHIAVTVGLAGETIYETETVFAELR